MKHFSSVPGSQRLREWLRPLLGLGCAALVLAPSNQAQAQAVAFAPVATYSSGGMNPYGLAVGDVNGDGRPDLVTLNSTSYTVAVLPGSTTSPGTFGGPATYASGGNTGNAISVALGDIDGDGRLDAVATNTSDGTVGVLLNLATAPGTFGPAIVYSTGNSNGPRIVALGDVNGDGRLDIATVSFTAGSLSILLNSATTPGTFGAPVIYSTGGNGTSGVALGDLNGDGRLDAVTLDLNTSNVSVFLNQAAAPGTFGAPMAYSNGVGSSNPFGLTLGDLNGDGRLDVATANLTSPTVSVLLNSTTTPGTLLAATTYGSGGTGPVEIAVNDLNGDGQADLAVSNYNSNTVGVLLNSATAPGAFAAATTFSTGAGTAPRALVLADLNADGRRDIATANFGAGTVGVLLNTSAFAVPTLTIVSPASGSVGTSITLTGTNLSSATAVRFNGVAATFTVVNATTITATVPAGATTGNVTVTTPGGTSNGLPFTVGYPDLTVSTTTTIPAGTYNSITVTGTGNGTLAGNVTVLGSTTVQSEGTLNDGCATISGAGSFTLAAGGTLGICAGAGISSSGATGAVQNTGARSFSTDASYVYNGTTAQSTGTGLPGQVRNLSTVNNSAVSLTQATSFTQVLTVGAAGNLFTNANALTLLSTPSRTALVVNSGTGVVVGNVTVQRAIDPSLNAGLGYRHYSSPVQSTNVADLATTGAGGNFTPVLNPTYNTSATPTAETPFPTVFSYNENRVRLSNNLSTFDKGYYSPTSPGDILVPTIGYTVNLDASQVVDFVGTLNTSTFTRLFGSNRPTIAGAGWQLTGNPYPAPLDLSRVVAADRQNLDASIYIFSSRSQYGGQYRAYTNGVGGGNPIIPVAQGFFVRVAAGQSQASLTFRNSYRLTAPEGTTFQRAAPDTRALVQLDLSMADGRTDSFYAYAQAEASAALDAAYDAEKLPNPMGLNLASVAGAERLAIDGRAAFTAATVIPLVVEVPAAGAYTLSAAALRNLPAGLTAYLHDSQTSQTVPLADGTSYAFSVAASQAPAPLLGRFTLQFSPVAALATAPALQAAEVIVYPNPAHDRFTVQVPAVAAATSVQAELLNALGQVVRRQAAALPAAGATLTLETSDLAQGVYVLRLQAGSSTLAKQVVVQ